MTLNQAHYTLDAEFGSQCLLNHHLSSGQVEHDPPRRKLTHEEQVALVESGQRGIVSWDIRRQEPERTLGGVSDWGGFV